MKNVIATLSIVLVAQAASAQTLTGVTVEPAVAKVGEPIKITASFSGAENPNCNVKVHFGDGRGQMERLNQPKDVPLIVNTSYDKPGDYQVQIEPKTNFPMLKCMGKKQFAKLTVQPLQKMQSSIKSAVPEGATPACPSGWALAKGSFMAKTGAYTCTAKANTPLPPAKLACPAPLGYFENQAKGQLGCRP